MTAHRAPCASVAPAAYVPAVSSQAEIRVYARKAETNLLFLLLLPLGTSTGAPRSASAQPVPRPVRLAFSSTEDASSSVPARTSPSAATPPPRSDPLPVRPDRGRRDGAVSDAALHTFIRSYVLRSRLRRVRVPTRTRDDEPCPRYIGLAQRTQRTSHPHPVSVRHEAAGSLSETLASERLARSEQEQQRNGAVRSSNARAQ